ncbi:hypothetical protein ARSEF1564_010128, partial [Beauveria bassiana]
MKFPFIVIHLLAVTGFAHQMSEEQQTNLAKR